MSKVVDIPKRATEAESIAYMCESFADALRSNADHIADDIEMAVLVYKTKGGGTFFESTGSATVPSIGMMCSAVHIACVYEMANEPYH
jgi:hypothetical protein